MDLNACSVNAIHHLRCLLATVIAHSMGMKLNKVLIEDCGKWAEQEDEKPTQRAIWNIVIGKKQVV